MSRHFPVCSAKDVIKALRAHGFVLVAQSGVAEVVHYARFDERRDAALIRVGRAAAAS